VEATHRIWVLTFSDEDVPEVDGKMMSTIAAIGVVVNVILAFVLGEDHAHMPVSATIYYLARRYYNSSIN
jgi:zinc transporter 2